MTAVAPLVASRGRRSARGLLVLAGAITFVALLTPAAPIVPVLMVLLGTAMVLAMGSTWHGVLAVMFPIVLVPIVFSVRVGGVSISFGRSLLFLLIIGWFANMRRPDRSFTPRRSPFDGPIVFLVGAMVFSGIVNLPNMNAEAVYGMFRKMGLFGVDFFLLFAIAVSVLTTEARVRRLLRIFAGLIVFTAALGIVERYTGRNVFEFLAPYMPRQLGQQVVAVAQSSVPTRGLINRTRATFEHPLAFGTVLLMALPIAGTLALAARERAARIAWGLGSCGLGAAILLTAGRSIYALAGLTFLTMLILLPDRRTRVALALVGVVVAGTFLAQSDVRRTMVSFASVSRGGALEGSLQSRVDDYAPVLDLFERQPLAGYGPRTFAPEAVKSSEVLTGSNVVLDNTYLGTLAETGIVGLLALVSLLAVVYGSAWRSMRLAVDREQYLIRLGLLIAVQNWILMGLAADTYQFNAPPRVFSLIMAAVAAVRLDAGWRAPRLGPLVATRPLAAADDPAAVALQTS